MLCAVEFEDRVVILHAATIDPCPWPRTIACVKHNWSAHLSLRTRARSARERRFQLL
jgi:hypothetical protein